MTVTLRRLVHVAVAAGLFLGACKGSEPAPAEGKSAASASAVEGAICAEHGVLEAVCTKCNPKLIPVFEAKGDWCEEHGFPESFCPICHPERGGKPATDVGDDGAPPDGTKVRFKSKSAAGQAGIATVKAEDRPGGARLEVLATFTYDATRRAELNARSTGVVRVLKVDVGAKVVAGAPLAVIESAEVGADRSRLVATAARVRIAEATYKREQDLHARGISSQRDVMAAEQELAIATSEQAATSSALGVVGQGSASRYTLTAPIAGTVVKRTATLGHMVAVEEVLFEIVDTSSMWAELDVPEADLGLVAVGQAVTLTIDGQPDRSLSGTIAYLAPEVDLRTRTTKARVAIANPDGFVRANMFGHAAIALGATRTTVMVPRAAVQRAKDVTLVFVKLGDDLYEARRVKTGLTEGDLIELTTGVKPGELVATTGSFLLKTETLKSSIGAGCCEAD